MKKPKYYELPDQKCPAAEVGDFRLRPDQGDVIRINRRVWTDNRGWVYGITYTKTNMCDLTQWQSGGSCFFVGEHEIGVPVSGLLKLQCELWRWRIEEKDLRLKANALGEKSAAIEVALKTISYVFSEEK